MNENKTTFIYSQAANNRNEKELWTTEDVMNFFDKGRTTIYNWRKKGYLKDRIIEGSVFFKKADVLALVERL